MSDKVLNNFFINQIEEHRKIAERCKSELKKPFINIVDICCNSLKKKKKFFFLEMVEVRRMLNIYLLN